MAGKKPTTICITTKGIKRLPTITVAITVKINGKAHHKVPNQMFSVWLTEIDRFLS